MNEAQVFIRQPFQIPVADLYHMHCRPAWIAYRTFFLFRFTLRMSTICVRANTLSHRKFRAISNFMIFQFWVILHRIVLCKPNHCRQSLDRNKLISKSKSIPGRKNVGIIDQSALSARRLIWSSIGLRPCKFSTKSTVLCNERCDRDEQYGADRSSNTRRHVMSRGDDTPKINRVLQTIQNCWAFEYATCAPRCDVAKPLHVTG